MPMPEAIAAVSGFKAILPNGKTVVVKSPPLRDAVRFMGLITDFENAKPNDQTLVPLLEEFPKAVGLTDADLEGLTLAEFRDVVVHFLSHRRAKIELILPGAPAASPLT